MLPERAKLSRDEALVFIDSFFFFFFFLYFSWLGRGEADAASAAFTGSLNGIAAVIHESVLTLCQIVCSMHWKISGLILRKDNLSKMLCHEKHLRGPLACVWVKAEQESATDNRVLWILCISLVYLGLWILIWGHKLCRSCWNLLNKNLIVWLLGIKIEATWMCVYIYIVWAHQHCLGTGKMNPSSAWLEQFCHEMWFSFNMWIH